MMMKFNTSIFNRKFIKFLLIGLLNTGITYILYLVFLPFTTYEVSYTLSYVIGIITSYIFNSSMVFRSKLTLLKFIKYPLVYIVQFFLNWIILKLAVNYFNIHTKFAPVIVMVITIPITFALSKLILEKK